MVSGWFPRCIQADWKVQDAKKGFARSPSYVNQEFLSIKQDVLIVA